MEVLPAEFARQAGVTRQSISAKIKNGTLILNSAGKLDTENPVNAGYLNMKRQQTEATHVIKSENTGGQVNVASRIGIPSVRNYTDEMAAQRIGVPAELLGLSLKDLVLRYGGILPLEKHAKVLKILTESAEKDLKMKERRLALVDKDFVISRLFQYVDNLMIQFLEYPESVADDLIARVLAEREDSRQTIIETMKMGFSKIIGGAKEQIISELNGLKHKYHDDSTALALSELKQEIKSELEAERDD
ncbi:hypothetical protein [Treponema denticola]|uniref:hypothetical protein n=1 Tax=Treponema denticola TaxID=158 RepID=UPI0003544040|nr:hypothetical protein [Treponema denticola]EPF37664.1 hypothetical protein HMPREF9732_00257 [Treponema denticola SP32]